MKRREFIALLGSAAASADAALDPPLSARLLTPIIALSNLGSLGRFRIERRASASVQRFPVRQRIQAARR
jgi:hypothetical protein